MRSPEAARALPELVSEGVLTAAQAAPLAAAANGEIVSVRGELRALLGFGVAMLTGGVGLFLAAHRDALGPTTIAAALTLAALGLLVALARRAPPFRWEEEPVADWALDATLLLAIALLGSDLAWIETHFTPLGDGWPWHLLLTSVVTGALAVRFDSTAAWSLALSTFAAWRGIAVTPTDRALEQALVRAGGGLRWNLLLCAVVFWGLGRLAVRHRRKAHFEPATTFCAALAAAVALATGLGDRQFWVLWATALAGAGVAIATYAFRARRLALFALGALAAYLGATRALFELVGSSGLGCFWFAASTAGAIALLVVVHRRFQAGERA